MNNNEIKTTPEIKKLAEEYKEEWYIRWHKIDPSKSNYINFHKYNYLSDLIAIAAERILRQSNDSLENHMLFVYILQGPEYEYTTGSRFTRWLKKKLCKSMPPEILRIVLDDKYITDISMDVVVGLSDVERINNVFNPSIEGLIKKLKETK